MLIQLFDSLVDLSYRKINLRLDLVQLWNVRIFLRSLVISMYVVLSCIDNRQVKGRDGEFLQLTLPSGWRNNTMKGGHDEVDQFEHARGIAVLRQRFY